MGHYVVAYKTMGQVFYFDPQKKIHSTNPGDLAQTNTITRFGMFYVSINIPDGLQKMLNRRNKLPV